MLAPKLKTSENHGAELMMRIRESVALPALSLRPSFDLIVVWQPT
jgi:hypothetical protein